MADWVASGTLATIAGISERKARSALERAFTGNAATWRGSYLIVREIPGRGGRNGKHYQVRVDSLPIDLQSRFEELSKEPHNAISHGSKAQQKRNDWYFILEPLIDLDKTSQRSKVRASLINKIATKEHRIDGETVTVSARTIRRKLEAYRRSGLAGLSNDKRCDINKRRVTISRHWQSACGLSAEKQAEIHDELRTYVRQLHREGEHLRGIIFRASRYLFDLSMKAGSQIAQTDCKISKTFVDRERHYRRVNRFERNRKAHEDAKPRILRTHQGMMPMDIVFGDVHHLDFDLAALEGYQETVKGVGWHDFATGRIHLTLFRLPKGQAIRNEHVIDSFIAMVMAWGLPKHLYLDNGGEFNFADFIDDALRLTKDGLGWIGTDSFDRQSQVTRAKSYNAAAKPIEGTFNILTNHIFPSLPGWRGGVLGNKKTPNVNRSVVPYSGTFDEFGKMISNAITIRNELPQGGKFAGKSPNTLLREAIQSGWKKTIIEPELFSLAFCKREIRKIDSGAISYGGRKWHCDEFDVHMHDRVVVLAPKYSAYSVLPVEDMHGELIGFAHPEVAYHPLDPRGAEEAARRQKAHNTAVRQLGKSIPRLDIVADNERIVRTLPAHVAIPEGDIITPTSDAQLILDAWKTGELDPHSRQSNSKRLKQLEHLNRKRGAA